jgi:hypothetical protein
MEFK